MLTIRLSLSKGIVLIPKRNILNKVNNGLELIKVLDDAQNNNVKVKILKNESVIVLDGSIATQKPSPEWISKEIDKKTTELLEIEEYYNNKFNIEVMFKSIVDTPISLSIRNLPDKKKEELIKLYEKNNTVSTGGTGVAMDKFSFVISELKQPRNPEDLKKGIIYMTKLSKVRTIDHAKLWPEYAAPKSNIISVLTMEDK